MSQRGRRRLITRIGYVGAMELIATGYRLLGRELVSPCNLEQPTSDYSIRTTTEFGGTADFHVTTKTAQRIKSDSSLPPAPTRGATDMSTPKTRCPECNGSGETDDGGEISVCVTCDGEGYMDDPDVETGNIDLSRTKESLGKTRTKPKASPAQRVKPKALKRTR